MTTTGELRAIIEELELVDAGDAASYLGEEALVGDEGLASAQSTFLPVDITGYLMSTSGSSSDNVN